MVRNGTKLETFFLSLLYVQWFTCSDTFSLRGCNKRWLASHVLTWLKTHAQPFQIALTTIYFQIDSECFYMHRTMADSKSSMCLMFGRSIFCCSVDSPAPCCNLYKVQPKIGGGVQCSLLLPYKHNALPC